MVDLGFNGYAFETSIKKDTLMITSTEFLKDPVAEADSTVYDKVIANGIVMDPDTNTYAFGYDIGIIGDEIRTITNVTLQGDEMIDATGLIVSPGFIDMLGFNLTTTVAKYKITDGVTTNLSLHGCTENFNGFFQYYESNPPYINYGGAIFAVKIRYERGLGANGTPTADDIRYMANRVREEIEAGGLVLSFSPEYYPGTTSDEIRAMMAVAAEYNIPTHFHARYSSITGEFTGIDGVKEVLGYAKELNTPVQFMHLHSTGGTGAMDEALALINEARDEGYDVTYDIYPYDSWASNIDWQRYRPGWQERYGITYEDLQMAGTTERLTEETFNYYRSVGGLCIAFAMDEDEMIQALSEPYAMVGSDGNIEREDAANNHFRGAGTFSRVLGKYVRANNAFSLMDGVRKMTINGARHLEPISEAMAKRGRLQIGCIADITIFDYRTILDQSTPEKPATPSIGIHYVLVSGQVSLDEQGVVTSQHAGQPIKSSF
jgi:N-acyl-D-aspartate/D-glutamate deacylase